jgi:hypothetical protein
MNVTNAAPLLISVVSRRHRSYISIQGIRSIFGNIIEDIQIILIEQPFLAYKHAS